MTEKSGSCKIIPALCACSCANVIFAFLRYRTVAGAHLKSRGSTLVSHLWTCLQSVHMGRLSRHQRQAWAAPSHFYAQASRLLNRRKATSGGNLSGLSVVAAVA
eukprot:549739-Amphidinium_carterae.1